MLPIDMTGVVCIPHLEVVTMDFDRVTGFLDVDVDTHDKQHIRLRFAGKLAKMMSGELYRRREIHCMGELRKPFVYVTNIILGGRRP